MNVNGKSPWLDGQSLTCRLAERCDKILGTIPQQGDVAADGEITIPRDLGMFHIADHEIKTRQREQVHHFRTKQFQKVPKQVRSANAR